MSDRAGPNGGTHKASKAAELPSDAVAIRKLLKSMGVDECEPRVVCMLLDFMYKYTSEVVLDAEAYADAAGRPTGEVDADDVALALQARSSTAFVSVPSQAVLHGVADALNALPLPPLRVMHGLRYPPEAEGLTNPHWRVEIPREDTAAAAEEEGAPQGGTGTPQQVPE